jgi:2-iminobutanoate/2-iminopropanoate deaminase
MRIPLFATVALVLTTLGSAQASEPALPVPQRPMGAHLSPAVVAGGFVFVSGQLAIRDNKLVPGDITVQTNATIDNIERILTSHGLGLSDVVRSTVWITRAEDFGAFNRAYAARFGTARPARSTVVSGLVLPGALIEIEVTAVQRTPTKP